jgi:hypothetical protein
MSKSPLWSKMYCAPIDDKAVAAIGFVKYGLADAFDALGVPAFTLWNSPSLPGMISAAKFQFQDSKTHIGVLGTGSFAKNIITQLMALCSMADTVVHW